MLENQIYFKNSLFARAIRTVQIFERVSICSAAIATVKLATRIIVCVIAKLVSNPRSGARWRWSSGGCSGSSWDSRRISIAGCSNLCKSGIKIFQAGKIIFQKGEKTIFLPAM